MAEFEARMVLIYVAGLALCFPFALVIAWLVRKVI